MTAPGAPAAVNGTPDTASRLRGFGPAGLLAILVILAGSAGGPFLIALLVLAWARLSRTPLHALGFVRPRSLTVTLLGGIAFGILFKLAMKAVVMPLLGAPVHNAAYGYLAGNAAELPAIVVTILAGAAFGEEVFFRGYLFERLGRLLGRGPLGLAGAVLFSAALFGIAHYPDQGLPGVQQAAITGLVFGAFFAWRRQIWFLMIAHAAFDFAAVAIIYWRLEEAVAHFLW